MIKPTIIIYGSSLGNTQFVAEKLKELLPGSELVEAGDIEVEDVDKYDNLILGSSTWGVGLLQEDFEYFMNQLAERDLSGKTIALFGLGDQQNYPDTFCDGLGKIKEELENTGARFVGQWPIDDYDFTSSRGMDDDFLVGLALDEDNEPDLTDYRLEKWVELILPELK